MHKQRFFKKSQIEFVKHNWIKRKNKMKIPFGSFYLNKIRGDCMQHILSKTPTLHSFFKAVFNIHTGKVIVARVSRTVLLKLEARFRINVLSSCKLSLAEGEKGSSRVSFNPRLQGVPLACTILFCTMGKRSHESSVNRLLEKEKAEWNS